MQACLAEVGVGLINRAYRGCYPLVFSVNAFLHKKYDRRANNHGKMVSPPRPEEQKPLPCRLGLLLQLTWRELQAALFWYNMLKNIPDVEDRRRPIIHVYQSDRTSSELKDEMRRKIFSIQYSDGTAILKKYRTSAHGTIVTASISVVIITLVLLLAVLVFLYRKMHRKLARIAVMATEAEIDTESPAIKVMKFLQVRLWPASPDDPPRSGALPMSCSLSPAAAMPFLPCAAAMISRGSLMGIRSTNPRLRSSSSCSDRHKTFRLCLLSPPGQTTRTLAENLVRSSCDFLARWPCRCRTSTASSRE